MAQEPTTSSAVIDTIMAHKSIRSFHNRPLPEGMLERLVEAGTRASTSSNMQAYSIISISDPALKTQVAALCANQRQIHESAAFLAFCADLHKLQLACKLHGQPADAVGYAEALLIAVIDTALVMQNVAVAAESLGLGICMIGAMRNHPKEVGRELRLPTGVLAIAGFCIGWPADEAAAVKPRLPLGATLHHNRYRTDDELRALITEYDEIHARWYSQRGMHPRDPRWSSVMSRRLPGVKQRREVDEFLCAQEFLTQCHA